MDFAALHPPLNILQPCEGFLGESHFFPDDPECHEASDVSYIPVPRASRAGEDLAWGVFDDSGRALPGSIDSPGLTKAGRQGATRTDRLAVSGMNLPAAPSGRYLYGGVMKLHYGHFLINTLARLWILVRRGRDSFDKIVFHGGGQPHVWLRQPFIRDIFDALGVSHDRIVVFEQPVRIGTLTVAYPSFREQSLVHGVFAELCNRIGRRVLGSDRLPMIARPAWLSKSALPKGIVRCVNEPEMERVLAAAGVDIVHPERLGFAEQVGLFSQRRHILGCLGSAFHTSIFSPPGAIVTALCPDDVPISNFALMDRANGNRAGYVFAPGSQLRKSADPHFIRDLELAHPERIADDLLRCAR